MSWNILNTHLKSSALLEVISINDTFSDSLVLPVSSYKIFCVKFTFPDGAKTKNLVKFL